jgi:predicted nucleic acid-binding protein
VAVVRGRHVIDASAVIAALLPGEPAAAPARRTLQACARGAVTLLSPRLLSYELAHTLLKAERSRSHRVPAEVTRAMADDLDQLGIALEPLASSELLHAAQKYGCSGYDAAYVALALRERVSLITADRRLARRLRARAGAPAVTVYPDDAA